MVLHHTNKAAGRVCHTYRRVTAVAAYLYVDAERVGAVLECHTLANALEVDTAHP